MPPVHVYVNARNNVNRSEFVRKTPLFFLQNGMTTYVLKFTMKLLALL